MACALNDWVQRLTKVRTRAVMNSRFILISPFYPEYVQVVQNVVGLLKGLSVLNLWNNYFHRFFVRVSLRILSALLMLNTPQLQKRAIVRATAAASRRF